MARGVGLDAGFFEAKVVELDGSHRKPRLTRWGAERVVATAATDGPYAASAPERADALKHAMRAKGVRKENVSLGFPCREAVLRDLRIPFVGDDAIRKVIKFEAENEIHSQAVDDMVVDFHTYERLDNETRVLVAAVPKASLSPMLVALEEIGVEPERVDLDAMALFRAAAFAGCFGEAAVEAVVAAAESDGDIAELLPTTLSAIPGRGDRARIVVDIGARSTRILAVIAGRLVDIRALRVGVGGLVDEIAEETGLDAAEAWRAIEHVLATGEDYHVAAAVAEAVEASEPVEVVLAAESIGAGDEAIAELAELRADNVPAVAVRRATDKLFQRLRREFSRFLAGLAQIAAIEQVFVTGGGSRLPGMNELLGEVFGAPIAELDVLAGVSHNLDPEEADALRPRIAVAIGLALGMMIGRGAFNFRTEDLAFRRRFDRIKFPLAIACMFLVFLPVIYGAVRWERINRYELLFGRTYSMEEAGDAGRGSARVSAQFFGLVGSLVNPQSIDTNVQEVEIDRRRVKRLDNREYEGLVRNLVEADVFDRLRIVYTVLSKKLKEEQAATGVYQDLQVSSGVYVLNYFAQILEQAEPQIGKFGVMEFELTMSPDGKRDNLVYKLAVPGADYRNRHGLLKASFAAAFSDPRCPFESYDESQSIEDVFREGEGAFYRGQLQLRAQFQYE